LASARLQCDLPTPAPATRTAQGPLDTPTVYKDILPTKLVNEPVDIQQRAIAAIAMAVQLIARSLKVSKRL
jgi:hypothetical protein